MLSRRRSIRKKRHSARSPYAEDGCSDDDHVPKSLLKKDARTDAESMMDDGGEQGGLRRSSRRRVEKSYAEVPDIILQSDDDKSPEDDDSDAEVAIPEFKVRIPNVLSSRRLKII